MQVLFKQGDDLRKDYMVSCSIRMAEAVLKEQLPYLIRKAAKYVAHIAHTITNKLNQVWPQCHRGCLEISSGAM